MFAGFLPLFFGAFALVLGRGASGGSADPVDNPSTDPTRADDPSPLGAYPVDAPLPAAPISVDRADDPPGDAYDIGWSGLTPEEQLMVELINRARMDPQAEVDRLDEGLASGISSSGAAPLAVTPELSAAARAHSQDMDDRNFFSHTNPSGQSPSDRAIEEGHGSRFVSENIGWVGSTRSPSNLQSRVDTHHDNLWESDGHQRNMMDDNWSEIGVGYDYGSHQGYSGSTFVTGLFGDRDMTYLTGVVIEDEDGDAFYDLGEGQGGVWVTADDGTTLYTTATWDSGGYSLALPPGTYTVLFEGGDLDTPYEATVVIGGKNVKLDVFDSGPGRMSAASPAPLPAPDTVATDVLGLLPEVPFGEVPEDEDDWEEDTDLLLV